MSDETKTSEDEGVKREAEQEVANRVAQAKSEHTALIKETGSLAAQIQDVRLKLNEAGEKNSEELIALKEKQTAIDTRMDNLVAEIKQGGVVGETDSGTGVASSEYSRMFDEHINSAQGDKLHFQEMRQIMLADDNSVDKETGGGILVPTDRLNRMIELRQKQGAFRGFVDTVPTARDAVTIDVVTKEPDVTWVGERENRPDTDTAEFGDIEIAVHEATAKPKLTNKWMQDTGFDAGAWLETRLARSIGRAEQSAFITGNTKRRPRGVLTYNIVDDSDWAWGSVGRIETGINYVAGTNTGFPVPSANSNPASPLSQALGSMDQFFATRAVWMMNRKTVWTVRDLTDTTGRSVWRDATQAGNYPTIFGVPVRVNDYMPDIDDDSYPIMLIAPEAYTIVDRRGVFVIRDQVTEPGFTKFLTSYRVGGGISNFEAVKLVGVGDFVDSE